MKRSQQTFYKNRRLKYPSRTLEVIAFHQLRYFINFLLENLTNYLHTNTVFFLFRKSLNRKQSQNKTSDITFHGNTADEKTVTYE